MPQKRKNTMGGCASDSRPQTESEAGANLPDPEHEIADAARPPHPDDCDNTGGHQPGSRNNQAAATGDKDIPAIGNLPDPEHEIDDAEHDDLETNEGDSGWFPATRN